MRTKRDTTRKTFARPARSGFSSRKIAALERTLTGLTLHTRELDAADLFPHAPKTACTGKKSRGLDTDAKRKNDSVD